MLRWRGGPFEFQARRPRLQAALRSACNSGRLCLTRAFTSIWPFCPTQEVTPSGSRKYLGWQGHQSLLVHTEYPIIQAPLLKMQARNRGASEAGLCEMGHHDSFQILDRVSQQGAIVPLDKLYNTLRRCIVRKDEAVGSLVHCHIARCGFEMHPFWANHVIRMYTAQGNLVAADKVFRKVPLPDIFMWESIISAHGEHGQAEAVTGLYQQMLQSGMRPNDYVFVAVIRACAHTANLTFGEMVHTHVQNSEFQSNVFVNNNLVSMYAKCGRLEDARKLFDTLPTKDVVTWNAMIAGYAQHGLGEEALNLFANMQRNGVMPDRVTLVCVLKSCANIGAIQVGKKVHVQILKDGLEGHLSVGSTLVDMYVKCGCLEDGRRVFDRLPTRNVVTYNALITGYIRHGLYEEALQLYDTMQQRGPKPDGVTLLSMLKVCGHLGAIQDGKRIHIQILEEGLEADVAVGSTLVDMYARSGSMEDARMVFNTLPQKNVVTWSVLIAGYAQQGLGEEALRVYREMQLVGSVAANHVTYLSLLRSCGCTGALQEGRELHEQIRVKGLEGDTHIAASLVDMYVKCGSVKDAHELSNRLFNRNVVTWNALIRGYSQHNDSAMVLRCFKDMQKDGVEPDAVTYTCLLVACSHVGLVDEGLQHFQSMSTVHSIIPAVEHYHCVVDLLSRGGRLDEAEKFLLAMAHEHHAVGWKSLLTASCTHGSIDLARRCFNRLTQIEPQHGSGYVLMSKMYIDAGRWEEAEFIEQLRKRAGAEKMPASALIEVKNHVHEFVVGERRDDVIAKLRSFNSTTEEKQQQCLIMSHKDNEDAFCGHAEKLALAYGLLNTPDETSLLVIKNLRMCNSCHEATKAISRIERRDIIIRDAHCTHRFKDGLCSCGDHH